MSILSIDFETRSAADLRKTGAARYFEDPSADVLCAAWCVEDGPVQTWRIGEPCPEEIRAHVLSGGQLAAWNATFEAWGWKYVLGPKHGWPVPALSQWVDTMAQAAAMSIPQSLDGAAQALAMEQQKDKDGMRLIRKFSIPRKAKKGEVPGRLYWNEPKDHPEDFDAFVRYCAQDVEVERAIRKKLVPLSDYEQSVWELTLRMNDRGAHLDMALVDALQRIAEQAKARLDKEMLQATGGAVSACSQVAALTRWLQTQGVDADKLNKNAIEDLLASELPEQARRAVELRKAAAKTSIAKLDAMQAIVCRDDRARGLHLYHGAGTGRWSSRLIQSQNLPRGTGTVKDPEGAVGDMLTGDARWIEMIYGQPMSAVSDMLRSCITASPGNRLLAADYSSIEGRVTAWLAGELDELDAYRANDAGTGAGIYEIAAGGIFNVDPFKVTKPQRQVGKAACVAEGQYVLTLYGLVRIEDLQLWQPVWDGEAWVEHGGVVYKGLQDVWEYDGLVATDDHIVFTEDGRNLPFGVCAREQIPLAKTGSGRKAVRLGGGDGARYSLARETGPQRTQGWLERSAHALQRLWHGEVDCAGKFAERQEPGLPVLLASPKVSEVAGQASDGSQIALPEPKGPRLGELWRSGCGVQISKRFGRGHLGAGEPGAASAPGVGQGRQQRALRAGQPEIFDQIRADAKPAPVEDTRTTKLAKPVLASHDGPASACRVLGGRDHGDGRVGGSRAPKELARYRGKARVYDVVNAGPRHRFTVSGVLVHNCLALGFGGGVLAFNSMASIYGIDMTPVYPILHGTTDPETFERAGKRYEECRERGDTGTDLMGREAWQASEVTKVIWRNKHPRTVELWRGLEDAAREAVQNPGAIATYGRISYIVRRGFLWCRLPSGRCLAYGSPRIEDRKTPWGDTKPSVTALGVDSVTKRWSRFALYGGLLTENAVQAVARDLMAYGMLKAEAGGYPMVMTVHDEGVTDVPLGFGSLAEFERLLCSLPSWAEGLPVVASGWEGLRYRKD